jgi:predicted metalloprotease with PDZ domain
MRHAKWLALALLVALVALPAFAGPKDKKCTASTQDCLDKMVQMLKTRGWVGIEMDDSKGVTAMTISKVVPGSPAEAAGFQVGDLLVSLEGLKYADSTEEKCAPCEAAKENWVPGRKVHYVVSRVGREVALEPTLGHIPSDVMAMWVGQHMLEHAQVEVAKK